MSHGRRGRLLVVTMAGLMLSATGAPGIGGSAGAVVPPPTPETARLQGPFELAGQITVAKRVLGEQLGQRFLRTWTFFPTCPEGPCDSIGLIRERAGGTDRLTLVRLAPAVYVGTGRFIAPLRCGRRTYARGQSVPFTITVQVTAAAALSSGAVVATSVTATYTNSKRTNLTRCFAVLGHDAATYAGQALPVPGQV
jgi:hypothetical protein